MSEALDFLDNYKTIRRRLWAGHVKEAPPERVVEPEPEPEAEAEPEPEPVAPRDLLMVATAGFPGGKSLRQEMREAVANIAKIHGITYNDIMSIRRTKKVVHARQEAMYYVKMNTTWSTPQIGQFFGGMDHTTILHGVRRHLKRMEGTL
jgi:hypothetical protein